MKVVTVKTLWPWYESIVKSLLLDPKVETTYGPKKEELTREMGGLLNKED